MEAPATIISSCTNPLEYISPLQSTSNLLDIYLHTHCYKPEQCQTPESFHLWSCLTAIAASVRDRIWVERHPGKKLKLNLYTFLVGDSGLGKDFSIDIAKSYVEPFKEILNLFDGRITHAGVMECLGRPKLVKETKTYEPPAGHFFLVTEELKQSLGSKGRLVQDFLALMTAMYSKEGVVDEQTRLAGRLQLKNPCWTWLSGSTPDWLFDCIDKKEIAGGAAARIIWIVEDVALDRLRPQYQPPPDYDVLRTVIRARFEALIMSPMVGKVDLTPRALERYNDWFFSRNIPEFEKIYWPTLMREPDLVWKLSALYCVADGRELLINSDHMSWGCDMVDSIRYRYLPKIIDAANMSPKTLIVAEIRDFIGKKGVRSKDEIVSYMLRKGHTGGDVEDALNTLQKAGQVALVSGEQLAEIRGTKKGVLYYVLTKKLLGM